MYVVCLSYLFSSKLLPSFPSLLSKACFSLSARTHACKRDEGERKETLACMASVFGGGSAALRDGDKGENKHGVVNLPTYLRS